MNVSPLNTIVTTTVPALKTDYQALRASIVLLRDSITVGALTVIPDNTANRNAALTDFQALMNSYIATIDGIIATSTGDLDVISSSSQTLSSTITSVNTTANSLIQNATTLPTMYDRATGALTNFTSQAQSNITTAVPRVTSSILTTIDLQQAFVDRSFQCQPVATDFMTIRQGLCGDVLASFDAWWSSLVIMSLYSFLSLPIVVFVANTLFLDLTQYQDNTDPEFGDVDDVVEGKEKSIQIGVSPPPNIRSTEEYESPTNVDVPSVPIIVAVPVVNEMGMPTIITANGSIPVDTNISEAIMRNPSFQSNKSGIKSPMVLELEQSLQRRSMMHQNQNSEIFVQYSDGSHSRQPSQLSYQASLQHQPGLQRTASQRSNKSQKRTSVQMNQPLPFDVPIVEQSNDYVNDGYDDIQGDRNADDGFVEEGEPDQGEERQVREDEGHQDQNEESRQQ
jgi:hypothetical protein